MSGATTVATAKRVKKFGATGVAIGVLSVLACELPIVLALVGLGGLSSAASVLSLPPMIEKLGITLGFLGLLLLLGLVIYRVTTRVKP